MESRTGTWRAVRESVHGGTGARGGRREIERKRMGDGDDIATTEEKGGDI